MTLWLMRESLDTFEQVPDGVPLMSSVQINIFSCSQNFILISFAYALIPSTHSQLYFFDIHIDGKFVCRGSQ